jgi:hypothetical protein
VAGQPTAPPFFVFCGVGTTTKGTPIEPALTLSVISGSYAICRLDAGDPLPAWATRGPFFSVTRTPAELSVVCEMDAAPFGVPCELGWRVLAVQGPLDFALTGIVARLTAVLAAGSISVFIVSTYDTDYVLVREDDLERAIAALREAGHPVFDDSNSGS